VHRGSPTQTFIALFVLFFPYRVFAQSDREAENLRSLAGTSELALHDLNEHGIAVQGTMIYDWSKEFEPGGRAASFARYSFDAVIPVDGKKLFGVSGSAGMIRLRHHLNNFGGDYVGETQLYSNIDASPRTTLYEAWIEERLFAETLRVKFGKIDANTEFAAVPTASDFLNSSMGYSPTIIAFPTYPEPKLGFNAFYRPTANNTLGVGVFQTASAGALTIVEPSHAWNLGSSKKPGRASAGYWHLRGSLARFDGEIASGTTGIYSVLEQTLWRARMEKESERRLSSFFQFGTADGSISPYQHHFGAGVVLQGMGRKRSQDAIGFATTWVRFSSQPGARFEYPGEFIFESYYKAAITRHIALVQDFQFVHHPGGLQANPDCPVVTPRLVIAF